MFSSHSDCRCSWTTTGRLGPCLLALLLNFSAYFAEILRTGYESVSTGQREAIKSLGLPPVKGFFLVTFPQAVAGMYPSLNSQFIFLFLTTGVISEIGTTDLTYAGVFIDSRTLPFVRGVHHPDRALHAHVPVLQVRPAEIADSTVSMVDRLVKEAP